MMGIMAMGRQREDLEDGRGGVGHSHCDGKRRTPATKSRDSCAFTVYRPFEKTVLSAETVGKQERGT